MQRVSDFHGRDDVKAVFAGWTSLVGDTMELIANQSFSFPAKLLPAPPNSQYC